MPHSEESVWEKVKRTHFLRHFASSKKADVHVIFSLPIVHQQQLVESSAIAISPHLSSTVRWRARPCCRSTVALLQCPRRWSRWIHIPMKINQEKTLFYAAAHFTMTYSPPRTYRASWRSKSWRRDPPLCDQAQRHQSSSQWRSGGYLLKYSSSMNTSAILSIVLFFYVWSPFQQCSLEKLLHHSRVEPHLPNPPSFWA